MFTGLVQAVGTIADVSSRASGEGARPASGSGPGGSGRDGSGVRGSGPPAGGVRLRIRAAGFAEGLVPGESVAIDGTCLTVVSREVDTFAVEAVGPTLANTTLGAFARGRRVNLERALRAGDPLGGHLVQGHVDGIGEVVQVAAAGSDESGPGPGRTGPEESAGEIRLRIELPREAARLTAQRGSLAVDGVSLTVHGLAGAVAELAIVPYTWSHTALDRLGPGEKVNVEADLLARYVDRLLGPYRDG